MCMFTTKRTFLCGWALLFMMIGGSHYAAADHDDHRDRNGHDEYTSGHHDDDQKERHKAGGHEKGDRDRSDDHKKHRLAPVDNAVFKEICGACHFAYQPELLPSRSWENILEGLEDHFGEAIDVDEPDRKVIAQYLESRAAEFSPAKLPAKIVKSLGSLTPLRITDIPYIREKHHDISAGVLGRAAIGSLSNCTACHRNAENGLYEDDDVVIPR